MLINLSNHPQTQWTEKQILAAKKKYKSIYDIPFPYISPKASSNQVKKLADKYYKQIVELIKKSPDKNNAVHLMGEFTFFYHLTELLRKKKIKIVVSTTDRMLKKKMERKSQYSVL